MKNVKKLLALLLAMVMLFTVCACGGTGSDDDDKDSATSSAKKNNKKDNAEKLEGAWLSYDDGLLMYLDEDGIGYIVDEYDDGVEFEWEVDGDELVFNYEDGEEENIEYDLDGDELILVNQDGDELIFERYDDFDDDDFDWSDIYGDEDYDDEDWDDEDWDDEDFDWSDIYDDEDYDDEDFELDTDLVGEWECQGIIMELYDDCTGFLDDTLIAWAAAEGVMYVISEDDEGEYCTYEVDGDELIIVTEDGDELVWTKK